MVGNALYGGEIKMEGPIEAGKLWTSLAICVFHIGFVWHCANQVALWKSSP